MDIQWTSPRTTLQRLPYVAMDASVGSGVQDLNLALVAAAADGDSVAVRVSLRAGADVHFSTTPRCAPVGATARARCG